MPVLVQFVEGAERFFFPQALQPGQRGDPVGPGQDRLAVRLVVPVEIASATEILGQLPRQGGLAHLPRPGNEQHLPVRAETVPQFVLQGQWLRFTLDGTGIRSSRRGAAQTLKLPVKLLPSWLELLRLLVIDAALP